MTDTATTPRTFSFTVHSQAAPQGSKRHLGRGIMVESSKRVKPYREAVRWAVLETWDRVQFPGPVKVSYLFRFVRPKSHPKRTVTWPTGRQWGDICKLQRSTNDALTDVGIIVDDSMIIGVGDTWKQWGESACVTITITEVVSQ